MSADGIGSRSSPTMVPVHAGSIHILSGVLPAALPRMRLKRPRGQPLHQRGHPTLTFAILSTGAVPLVAHTACPLALENLA